MNFIKLCWLWCIAAIVLIGAPFVCSAKEIITKAGDATITIQSFALLQEATDHLWTVAQGGNTIKTVCVSDLTQHGIMPLRITIANNGEKPMAFSPGSVQMVETMSSEHIAQFLGRSRAWARCKGFALWGALSVLVKTTGRRLFGLRPSKKNIAAISCLLAGVVAAYVDGAAVDKENDYIKEYLDRYALNGWEEIQPGESIEKWLFVPTSPEVRTMNLVIKVKGQAPIITSLEVQPLEMALWPTVYY